MSGLDRTADALLSQKAAQTAAYEELQSTFGQNSRKIRSLMVSLSMTQEDIDRLGAQKDTIVSSDARLTKRFQEIKDRHVAQTHVTNQCTDTTVSVSKVTKEAVTDWDSLLPSIASTCRDLALQTDLSSLEDEANDKLDTLFAVTDHLRSMTRLANGSRILFKHFSEGDGGDATTATPFDVMNYFQKWEEIATSNGQDEAGLSTPATDESGTTPPTPTLSDQQRLVLINELPGIKALASLEESYKLRQAAAETKIVDVKSKMAELAAKKAALEATYNAACVSLEKSTKARDDLKNSIVTKKQANQETQAVNDALKASISAKEASLSLGASEREKRVEELTTLGKEMSVKLTAANESMVVAVTRYDCAEAERQTSLKSLSELEVSRAVWNRRLAQDRRILSLRNYETKRQHVVVSDALKEVTHYTKSRCDAELEWKKAQQATTDTKTKIASVRDTFSKQDDLHHLEIDNFYNEELIIRNHIELEYNDVVTFEKYWFDKIMDEVVYCQISEYNTTISLEELDFSTIVEAHINELDELISRMAALQAAAASEKFKQEAEAAQRALAAEHQQQQAAPGSAAKTTVVGAKKPVFILKTVAKVDYSDSEDGGISLGREFQSEERCYDMAPPQRQIGSGGGGRSTQKPLMSSLLTSQSSILTSQRPSILQSRAGQHAATLPTTPTVANQKGLQSANPTVLTTPSSQQRIRHTFLPPVPKFAATTGAAAQSSSSASTAAVAVAPPSSSTGGNVGRAPLISDLADALMAPRRTVLGKKRAASPTDSFDSYSSILRPNARKSKIELTAFEHQSLFGVPEDYSDEEDRKVLQNARIKPEVRPPPNSYKPLPTPLPGTVGEKHKKVLDEIAREHSVCNIPTDAITGSKSPSPRRPTITNKSHPMLMAVAQVVKNMPITTTASGITGRPSGGAAPPKNKPASATTTTAAANASTASTTTRFHLSTTNNNNNNHGTPKRAPHASSAVVSPTSITTPRRQVTATSITSPQHKITNGGSDKRGGGGNNNNSAAGFDLLSPLSNTSHNNNNTNALLSTTTPSTSAKKNASAVLQPPPASPGLSFTQRMLGGLRKQPPATATTTSDSLQLDGSGGRSSVLLRSQATNSAAVTTTSSTKGRGGGAKLAGGRRSGIIAPQDENDEFAL